jgi:outer membrane protein W
MRKIVGFVVTAFACCAASAQQTQTLSAFVSNNTDEPSYGISYERMFAPRWSVQAAVAVERHHSYGYVVEDNGAIAMVEPERLRTVPIDLTAGYHWPNDTRWKPFLGIGAHYVAAPDADPRFRYRNHLHPAINGGTLFMLTHNLGLMLDGRIYLGDHEPYDDNLKTSIGLSWRF